MASTPKVIRRNGGNCVCPDGWKQEEYRDGTCRYRYCFSAKCLRCGGEIWGMGPVACKCEGAPRWLRHRHMAQLGKYTGVYDDEFVRTHAAVKPSIARRRRGSRQSR